MGATEPKSKGTSTPVVVMVIVLVLLCAAACCCAAVIGASAYLVNEGTKVAQEPTPAAEDFIPGRIDLAEEMARRLEATALSDTNYWTLHGQLVSETGEPVTRSPVQSAHTYEEGDIHTFWMGDEEVQRYWQVEAELIIRTENAYFYVSEGTQYDLEALGAAAELFEDQIYPTNHETFGVEWLPGIDNDPHVTILVTDQMPPRIAGYFGSGDEYPRTMKLRSNEREMFFVTVDYIDDLDEFGQLLSHELQHMIHWNQDTSEATWLNEGLSLMAEEVNHYPGVLGGWDFWRNPDIQLTNWSEDPNDRLRDYAASKLFLSYLTEHYGGYEVLRGLAADRSDGIEAVENLLAPYYLGFEEVFADWVVANQVNDGAIGEGLFAYPLRGSSKPEPVAMLGAGESLAGWVSQFGADSIEIRAEPGSTIRFEGNATVLLADTETRGDYSWWSNRRNMLSSSLTRGVDLTEVDGATLQFWTWYDIETDFDYGYVAVSTDEGRTWQTVPGVLSTDSDPNGANYGHGYTGKSSGWLHERVDLSAYVGERILLRFWYLTDPGQNQSGWLIDDIEIAEIGFEDAAEGDGAGWQVDGFVRSTNIVPQEYVLRLVEYGAETTVREMSLDRERTGEISLAADTRRAVVIVAGASRWTSERAPYRLWVDQ